MTNEKKELTEEEKERFNPCFNGSCTLTWGFTFSGNMGLYVSILVLMEVAL